MFLMSYNIISRHIQKQQSLIKKKNREMKKRNINFYKLFICTSKQLNLSSEKPEINKSKEK